MRQEEMADDFFASVDSLFAYLLGSLAVALGVYTRWVRVDPFHEGPIPLVHVSGMDSGFELLLGHALYWTALCVAGVALLETGALLREVGGDYRATPLLAAVLGLAALGTTIRYGYQYHPFADPHFEMGGGSYLLGIGGSILLWAACVHYLSDRSAGRRD